MRGNSFISDRGSEMASAILFRINSRASWASSSAVVSTSEAVTLDLGVELQGRDHVPGAGHLEVHVPEGVLRTEDVGEGDVLAIPIDEAHRDSGDRGDEIGTPASIRDSDDAHTDAIEVDPFDERTSDTSLRA